MASFVSKASHKVTDVRTFLREAAGGPSIKYAAESGARHLIYIPTMRKTNTDENGTVTEVEEIQGVYGAVHEWTGSDGKYHSTICLKDVVRMADDDVTMLNDGSCPFCDRVEDGWNIRNYRKEAEEAKCQLTGEDRKKYLEKTIQTFNDERKAKAARVYMYLLIAKFRTNADGSPIIGQDGLPDYEMKVMKLSQSRVDKIQQQLQNSGCEMAGSELVIEYPQVDDQRLRVSQSTTSPVFPTNMLTKKYPGLLDKINQDVGKFSFDNIEKSFPEWNGMSVAEAKKVTDALFEKWDEYREKSQVDPNFKYMEYVTNTPVTHPSLTGAPVIPSAPVVPGAALPSSSTIPPIPGVATPETSAPTAPTAPVVPPVPTVPGVDPNAVFSGGAPNISI